MLFWKQQTVIPQGNVQRVSILILLDVILEVRMKINNVFTWKVSILILLDVILEVMYQWIFLHQTFSFNPYFVGCYSGSPERWSHRHERLRFQSLFCWMLFWKLNETLLYSKSNLVSILILLDVILEVCSGIMVWFYLECFNPYFVGCYSGRKKIEDKPYMASLFQSLFCWMLFWKQWLNGK